MISPLAFFLGPLELTVVLVVVMLLFGNRIPGMARSLGQGIVEFRKGLKGDEGQDQKQIPGDQGGGSTGDSSGSSEKKD